jgi:Holliday junction resolvasome RuvABC ATP-dependent DNA helicase subunit
MIFIGQENIKTELNYILSDIRNGINHNILFRAPSGYGKTRLGFLCMVSLGGLTECDYCIPKDGMIFFNEKKRIHFIDEVHTLANPEEIYPYLDSEKFTFFLMSNESGSLKEPLRRRCIQLIFSKYTDEELARIVDLYLPNSPEILIKNLIGFSPGEIKVICDRLSIISRNGNIQLNEENSLNLLNNILNIKDGLTNLEEVYMNYLRTVKISSLNNIIGSTHLDKETVLFEIEPRLLYNGLISITSRGRKIKEQNESND